MLCFLAWEEIILLLRCRSYKPLRVAQQQSGWSEGDRLDILCPKEFEGSQETDANLQPPAHLCKSLPLLHALTKMASETPRCIVRTNPLLPPHIIYSPYFEWHPLPEQGKKKTAPKSQPSSWEVQIRDVDLRHNQALRDWDLVCLLCNCRQPASIT